MSTEPAETVANFANAISELLNNIIGVALGWGSFTPAEWQRFREVIADIGVGARLFEDGKIVMTDDKGSDFHGILLRALPQFEGLCARDYDHDQMVAAATLLWNDLERELRAQGIDVEAFKRGPPGP